MEQGLQLQVLRTLDKYDRVGDTGVFDLLTTGRTDESGAFTEGCGLTNGQATTLVGFLNAGRNGVVAERMWTLARLETTVVNDETGETAFDQLLALKPDNIAWALDDIFANARERLGQNPRGSAGNDRVLEEMAQMLVPIMGG